MERESLDVSATIKPSTGGRRVPAQQWSLAILALCFTGFGYVIGSVVEGYRWQTEKAEIANDVKQLRDYVKGLREKLATKDDVP